MRSTGPYFFDREIGIGGEKTFCFPSFHMRLRSGFSSCSGNRGEAAPQRRARFCHSQFRYRSSTYPAQTILSSLHGRLRRQQRGIDKSQLYGALRRGVRFALAGRRGISKYKYQGITFIYNEITRREITSYVDALDVPYEKISIDQRKDHDQAHERLLHEPMQHMTSHSILMIDSSGSMAESDVQGARSRLSAVFLAMARDFVLQRIKSGNAGLNDAVSIIQMGEKPNVLWSHLPTDYITYNRILTMYKEGTMPALGHCCYQPALEKAMELFDPVATSVSCNFCVLLFTDGRPSDAHCQDLSWNEATKRISDTVQDMSRLLGHRLTVQGIGIGQSKEKFKTLSDITEVANRFGSLGQVQLPSMSSSGLGQAVSTVATRVSLMGTEELQHSNRSLNGLRLRSVQRENKQEVAQTLLTEVIKPEEYHVFMLNKSEIRRKIYRSSDNSFVTVPNLEHPEAQGIALRREPFGEGTERFAYQCFEVAADGRTVVGEAMIAKQSRLEDIDEMQFAKQNCRVQARAHAIAELFQEHLHNLPKFANKGAILRFLSCSIYTLKQRDTKKKIAINNETAEAPISMTVVVERRLFGKFEKWNSNNGWTKSESPRKTPCIRALVAIKEEPEIEKLATMSPSSPDKRKTTAQTCSTGHANIKPDNVSSDAMKNALSTESSSIDQTVIKPDDVSSDGMRNITTLRKSRSILSETAAPDAVADTTANKSIEDILVGTIRGASCATSSKTTEVSASSIGDAAVEASETSISVSAAPSTTIIDLTGDDGCQVQRKLPCVSKDEIAQAFSHFSYTASGRQLLVCDLQGTYERGILELTDPVIHSLAEEGKYGRTDRGSKGIEDFLESHRCNALCEIVTLGFFSCREARCTATSASDSNKKS